MQYLRIAKPQIVGLFLLTVLAAMLIAGWPSTGIAAAVLVAVALTVGGAAALNNFLERGVDARMQRTRRRPTAAGTIEPSHALAFGISVTVLGVAAVWAAAGPLAAAFAAVGAFYYVVVYTMLLKPHLALSSIPGALAGIFPALIGWAATGTQWSAQVLFLCAVIVVWSPPHFWALALARSGDYRASGIPAPAGRYGERVARWLIVLAAAVLVAVTIVPAWSGMFGWLYIGIAAAAGLGYIALAVRLLVTGSAGAAWTVHKLSGPYLGVIMVAMVVDCLT